MRKEYVKAVYCHLAYLTSMQSASCEMPGWMMHRLESRLPGEISDTSDTSDFRHSDDTALIAECKEELKGLLMKVKEESEKADLKLNIHKSEIMASGPITSCQIDGETMETVTETLFTWAPKSLWMVTAAMKLKDACSLEERLWPT